jgi:NDP-4-keto-2,6-dideoxyhexose 3-C-methyltransferase
MKITQCRVCHNKELIYIGTLGNIAISDFTKKPKEGDKYPLELVYCEECTLLQLNHTAPRDLLYKDYWYKSALNQKIVNDLGVIASYAGQTIIDIGSNDGTLLDAVDPCSYRIAVDPSNIKPEGADEWINDYWENVKTDMADTITAIACLYDLPDPNAFIANVKGHLKPDGLFIAQLMTLQPMIEMNDVGNICHEHLEYYSYKSLVRLFEQNGLEIFRVEENDMNGGSYRVFARHKTEVGSIHFVETEYTADDLRVFFVRVEQNKEDFLAHITMGEVYAYGASTKGNTILQYYGLTPEYIPAIIDINKDKIGKHAISSGIQVINYIPEHAEFLWVLPWGFVDYFQQKEKGYKGKWITTTPEFKIL